MADIKQAAKWMNDGHNVTRPGMKGWFATDSRDYVFYVDPSGRELTDQLDTHDILSDDWEIAK
jgi:hypothetical protein